MADVHVLDEAQDDAGLARPARHRHDARLVDAAPDDHVDLDRREPRLDGGVDAVEHPRDREVDPVHRAEHRVVERIEADGDPPQARLGKRSGETAQGGPVGRQGQVDVAAVGRPERREHAR